MTNPILNSDSYKSSHYLQYPPKTTLVRSYIEARGVASDSGLPDNTEVVFFGLQAYLMKYLSRPFSYKDINDAEKILKAHGLPFNRDGWEHIWRKWHGLLPLDIEAVAEGTPMPVSNIQVQVHNTDSNVPWLTSYIETALLRAVWYPSTVATLSRECKKMIKSALDITCDDPDSVLPFRLHDFGARGVSSEESAALGGMAHLVNFQGTDTLSGILAAYEFYGCDSMPGFSIPAAEHSTITSWGKENEEAAYANMVKQFGSGLYSVVSDSYDIYDAVERIWGNNLRDAVKGTGGTLVVRPDSGDPATTVLAVLERLKEKFGVETNQKGYQVLDKSVRVIQGDGMEYSTIGNLCHRLIEEGWSIENVAFGMGGGLLQKVNRDTLKYAMKCNEVVIDGERHDVFKQPKTDAGKSSKKGRRALVMDQITGLHQTVRWNDRAQQYNQLQPVFLNGRVERYQGFDSVRKNAAVT